MLCLLITERINYVRAGGYGLLLRHLAISKKSSLMLAVSLSFLYSVPPCKLDMAHKRTRLKKAYSKLLMGL